MIRLKMEIRVEFDLIETTLFETVIWPFGHDSLVSILFRDMSNLGLTFVK